MAILEGGFVTVKGKAAGDEGIDEKTTRTDYDGRIGEFSESWSFLVVFSSIFRGRYRFEGVWEPTVTSRLK